MADFTGVTNPKRVIQRREEEAGSQPATAKPPVDDAGPLPRVRFEKQFSEEDRKKQKAKLEEMLRKRGPVSDAGGGDSYA